MARAADTGGVVDTDILVDAQRGRADAKDFLTIQRFTSGLVISVISAMELIVGCRNAVALERVQQFLRHTRILPMSEVASYIAYHLMQSFFLSHGLLLADALIAATSLEYGGTLYTKNVRHFRMISGLRVIRPY